MRGVKCIFKTPRSVFIGGEKGTQTNDITCAASMWLENGHESHPLNYIVAQADIEHSYDSLDPIRIAAQLLAGTRWPDQLEQLPLSIPAERRR